MHKHSGEEHKRLQIWFCQDCNGVHMRSDNVCLSFTREEFKGLSEAVIDIYRTEIADGTQVSDSVLDSDLIG